MKWKLVLFYVVFGLLVLGAHFFALSVCAIKAYDCPADFPFSVFRSRTPEPGNIVTALFLMGFFLLALRYFKRSGYTLVIVLICATLLLLGSNLIQGEERAFAVPVAGNPTSWLMGYGGQEYYQDALKVGDPIAFVRDYDRLQPDLYVHSQTHPPGAVLTLWLLSRLTPDAEVIGILIACFSTILSGVWLYGILRTQLDSEKSSYGVWLYLLIPAVQIYYAASLDAVIATLLIGALYGIVFARSRAGQITGYVCLLLASWLTFAVLFFFLVLGFDCLRRRSFQRLVYALLVVASFYSLLYGFLGFSYIWIFQQASAIENPYGFRLIAAPVEYFFTRLEDSLEILVFFSPILIFLAIAGVRIRSYLRTLGGFGIAAILLMFATGAFRTGETARACLFVDIYLLLPVLNRLKNGEISLEMVASVVFLQTILMQLFAGYFW